MIKYQMKFLERPAFHLALIALLGLLAYSNTFHVPFQWDEYDLIENNAIVKDISYFFEPAKIEAIGPHKSRCVGYLTFALNYKLHGCGVTGYHIVNTAIHILNALLVYILVALTFGTPYFKRDAYSCGNLSFAAFFSALLFVSHPVQTEAITYIYQRFASLSAFFYLFSLVLYVRSRSADSKAKSPLLYALSLISAVLAMKTKENAFTLPIVIALYEFLFFSGPIAPRIYRLIPYLMTLFLVPLTYLGTKPAYDSYYKLVGASRWDYLFTQFGVIATYIRILFLPVNQNVAYDYPMSRSFFTPGVYLPFIALMFIAGVAVYLLYRSRHIRRLRLMAFGIFWFFITLSVESSIVPLPMVINEYRVYLPSAGVFIAAASAGFLLFEKARDEKCRIFAALLLLLIPLAFLYATYARNAVWGSHISLWEDAARKSPLKPGVHNNLGNAYFIEGLTDRAIEQYKTAVKQDPSLVDAYYNLGLAYIDKGMSDEARREFETVLKLNPAYARARQQIDYIETKSRLDMPAAEMIIR